jgi:hypothetical protein
MGAQLRARTFPRLSHGTAHDHRTREQTRGIAGARTVTRRAPESLARRVAWPLIQSGSASNPTASSTATRPWTYRRQRTRRTSTPTLIA